MILLWEEDCEKYHFYNVYKMCTPLVCIELMLNKQTKKVDSNSVSIEQTIFTKFSEVNNHCLEHAKLLAIEYTLAYFDYLTIDPRNSHISAEELRVNFNSLSETYINTIENTPKFKTKEPLQDMLSMRKARLRFLQDQVNMGQRKDEICKNPQSEEL